MPDCRRSSVVPSNPQGTAFADFDCDIAVNGREAIDSFVLAHESKRPYEVIFLDIMMPEVDGLEALHCIRALERKIEIPHAQAVKVVMATALDDPKTVIKSLNECQADMPVMNGYELVYKLKQLNPLLPIIISSGFGEGDIASKIPREEIAGLINKPYNFEQLRDVLRGVVEG